MEMSCLAMEIQCASYLLNLSILWVFPSHLKAKGKQEGKQDELEDLQTKSLGLHYIDCFFSHFCDWNAPSKNQTYHKKPISVRIDAAASKSATLKALKSRELKVRGFPGPVFALHPEGRISMKSGVFAGEAF